MKSTLKKLAGTMGLALVLGMMGCKANVDSPEPNPDHTHTTAGSVAKAGLTINGKAISKTSEIVVVPAGTTATVEMSDDSAWSGFVSSGAPDYYKGVFLKNRKVKLSPFVMGQYPVTRDLYKAVMGSDPSTATSHETQGENPVNYVNWFDAIIFCNKLSMTEGLDPVYSYSLNGKDETDPAEWAKSSSLGSVPTSSSSTNYANWKDKVKIDITKNGYRLPTEAEWEFAARGGDLAKADWKYAFSGVNVYGSEKVHDGSYYLQTDTNLATVGWYTNNSSSGTHGVGLKKANALNLYDMSGNVREWCNDFCDASATKNDSAYTKDGYVTDPLGAASGSNRCQRGGSWNNNANNCAVSYRNNNNPYNRNNNYGFRVCRSSSMKIRGREFPVILVVFLLEPAFSSISRGSTYSITAVRISLVSLVLVALRYRYLRRFKADTFLLCHSINRFL